MSATCPYCGAKLNLGLKFCVVCGRHVTQDSMGRVGGGLRGGFRPADITRRLDELITVARFRRSRRSHEVERGTRFIFINSLYLLCATGLFYAAIQFSLEMVFPGKFKETRIPFDKIAGFIQEKTSGTVVKNIPATNQVVIIDSKGALPAAQKPKEQTPAKKSKKKTRTKKKRIKRSSRQPAK